MKKITDYLLEIFSKWERLVGNDDVKAWLTPVFVWQSVKKSNSQKDV
jgi:hypothetical protein